MIKTERLELYPLSADELKLWTEHIPELEKKLTSQRILQRCGFAETSRGSSILWEK